MRAASEKLQGTSRREREREREIPEQRISFVLIVADSI